MNGHLHFLLKRQNKTATLPLRSSLWSKVKSCLPIGGCVRRSLSRSSPHGHCAVFTVPVWKKQLASTWKDQLSSVGLSPPEDLMLALLGPSCSPGAESLCAQQNQAWASGAETKRGPSHWGHLRPVSDFPATFPNKGRLLGSSELNLYRSQLDRIVFLNASILFFWHSQLGDNVYMWCELGWVQGSFFL